jgi:hypothetical protein
VSDPAAWDARYADGAPFGDAPNEYLRSIAWRLRPGQRAWLPGDGDARNGAWLAAQGLQVVSTDWSAQATAAARLRASRAGVTLQAETQDVTDGPPGQGFNLIAIVFVHVPPADRARLAHHVCTALGPRGLLAIEAFRPAPAGERRGGPADPSLLWSAAIVRDLFGTLTPLELLEGSVHLDEGPRHQGLSPVLRALLRAP